MATMLRWSPRRQFHFHHDVDALLPMFFDSAMDQSAQRAETWLPAAEGRLEDSTYVIQLALPGVNPKNVTASFIDSVLTVKGERTADEDTAGTEHFVREVAYGTFQRSLSLLARVAAAHV